MTFRKHLKYILAAAVLLQSLPAAAQGGLPSFADLAERLIPSVVNISTISRDTPEEEKSPDFVSPNPAIEHFFNQKENNQVALGSGFIISEDGYIVTNYHVIDKAEVINVILSDNTKVEAELIGTDLKTDIALIKITTNKKLSPAVIGNSDNIRVGDWVLAIGNPFGLGGSVTAGIVSAKSRDIESGPYDNFIQTDASINQGSSGGPMFNMRGEVIGINSAIFSTSGGNMGIGFAIPVNQAGWVIEQLKNSGEVKRGWIGIKIQPNTEEIAAAVGLSVSNGVLVSGLAENSPAAKAGIQAGDIVLNFDGHDIDNTKNLSRLVAETAVGHTAPIEIWRNKQKLNFKVPVELMAEEPAVPGNAGSEQKPAPAEKAEDPYVIRELGIKVSEIDAAALDKFQLPPDSKGVVVSEIYSYSDAVNKGLRIGDVIVKVDKKDVFSVEDLKNFVNEARRENNRPVLLLVQDKGILHFAAIKLVEKK